MIAGLHLMMPEFKINKQEFLYVCTSIVYRLDHVEVCLRQEWNLFFSISELSPAYFHSIQSVDDSATYMNKFLFIYFEFWHHQCSPTTICLFFIIGVPVKLTSVKPGFISSGLFVFVDYLEGGKKASSTLSKPKLLHGGSML